LQPTPPRKLDLIPIPSYVSFVKAWDFGDWKLWSKDSRSTNSINDGGDEGETSRLEDDKAMYA